MVRLPKQPGERRVNIPATLSNERDQLLRRFQQAYCWRHDRFPSEAEIREEVRPLIESAIRAYIEAAEADTHAKMV